MTKKKKAQTKYIAEIMFKNITVGLKKLIATISPQFVYAGGAFKFLVSIPSFNTV